MLSSSLDTLLKVSKTTSLQKLFAYDCATLYIHMYILVKRKRTKNSTKTPNKNIEGRWLEGEEKIGKGRKWDWNGKKAGCKENERWKGKGEGER